MSSCHPSSPQILRLQTCLAACLTAALCASLVAPRAAFAADSHSDSHGAGQADAHGAKEAPAKAAKHSKEPAEAKPASKSLSSKPLAEPVESQSTVSMSALRELIDQKIAEVRAKQEAAPVVKVSPPRVRAKPQAAAVHGATAPAAPAALAVAHGAAAMPKGVDGHDVHWAYGGDTGPVNWGTLKSDFKTCMLGRRQSPIDIRDGIKVELEPIAFDYRPTPFRVIDNGHTVQVNLDPGNSITVLGRRYDLLQFHFHRPSEERINGRQYEMVAHLVHKDGEGRLAVVAVLMDLGIAHPMVQLVWNSLPLEKGIDQYSPVMIDLNLMLPEQRQYYTYMGSLTTPPCSEGVLWMVMKQPATMSRDQINIFSRLYPMNARPIQPASGRLIKDGQ